MVNLFIKSALWSKRLTESSEFHGAILVLILFASLLVGLETYPGIVKRYGRALNILDCSLVGIFVIEILLRMISYGRSVKDFFKDPWNTFDFGIVAICALPLGTSYLSVLRLVRVLRVFRLVSAIPRLQVLASALLKSIPSMGYVGLILLLLFYIYAVLGTLLFGKNDPIHFGSLGMSLLSLFRVVTLEDWTDLMYIQMYGCSGYGYESSFSSCTNSSPTPLLSITYFISFVIIGTMIVLNLFLGVVLNSMAEAQREVEIKIGSRNESKNGVMVITSRFSIIAAQLEQLKDAVEELSIVVAVQQDKSKDKK